MLKLAINETTFVLPQTEIFLRSTRSIEKERERVPISRIFFSSDYTLLFYQHDPPSSCTRAAGGNLFSFICCVDGIYASSMQPDPERPSYGQKWIERLAPGYFTNMWPENTPRSLPSSYRRDPFGYFLLNSGLVVFSFAIFRFCTSAYRISDITVNLEASGTSENYYA